MSTIRKEDAPCCRARALPDGRPVIGFCSPECVRRPVPAAEVKLVLNEPESEGLRRWMAAQGDARATSAITRVEMLRAARRLHPGAVDEARRYLRRVDGLPVDRDVLDRAAVLPVEVRSLEAIHLASALAVGDLLRDLVTYDRRMAVAADRLGISVVSPG